MTSDVLWTPPKLVKWITDDFTSRGMPGALRLEAERLVSYALKISRLDIYLQFDKPCSLEEQAAVRELVIRRRNREPLSYIMGSTEFRSLAVIVGPGVLIPRPETELLVDAVLTLVRQPGTVRPFRILELGTGTAVIPVSLALEEEQLELTVTECSDQALKYAEMNIERYREEFEQGGSTVHLIKSDRFAGIGGKPEYDCIVSNPPYIPTRDLRHLQEEVRNWEPGSALDGGEDGLDFYRYLKAEAGRLLKAGGYLVFEHGFDQQKPIIDLMDDGSPLKLLEAVRDYTGHDRILAFQKDG